MGLQGLWRSKGWPSGSQGLNVTRSQGLKVTRSQGVKVSIVAITFSSLPHSAVLPRTAQPPSANHRSGLLSPANFFGTPCIISINRVAIIFNYFPHRAVLPRTAQPPSANHRSDLVAFCRLPELVTPQSSIPNESSLFSKSSICCKECPCKPKIS